MSASPQQEDSADRYDEDIEENDQPNAEEAEGELLSSAATAPKDAQPAKRGRGRPKGSKNKKSGAASPTTAPSDGTQVRKKRGRPPKEKKPDDSGVEEPPAKRRRGRPRKEQKPEETYTVATSTAATGDGLGETSVKKKRGRPKKT